LKNVYDLAHLSNIDNGRNIVLYIVVARSKNIQELRSGVKDMFFKGAFKATAISLKLTGGQSSLCNLGSEESYFLVIKQACASYSTIIIWSASLH